MIIVADTTPLSELSKIDKLDLLQALFGTVIIPQEVYQELTTGNHPAVSAVKSASWIEVCSVKDRKKVQELQFETGLDLGECSAIVLAEELDAEQLLIDEKAGRKVALTRNLPILGLVGAIILAKDKQIVETVKDILDALINRGTRISPKLYNYALITAKEI